MQPSLFKMETFYWPTCKQLKIDAAVLFLAQTLDLSPYGCFVR